MGLKTLSENPFFPSVFPVVEKIRPTPRKFHLKNHNPKRFPQRKTCGKIPQEIAAKTEFWLIKSF
jgi:hypothetical protein